MSTPIQEAAAPPPMRLVNGLRYPFAKPPPEGRLQEVAHGVFWAQLPLPFVLNHINVWLIEDGDGWTLVDTGLDSKPLRALWETLLRGPLQGRPVTRILVTHMHPDHVGLAGWLTRRFAAEFCMSRTDYLMCRVLAADTGRSAPPEAIRFYRAAGFTDSMLQRYVERFGFFGKMIDRLPDAYTRLKQGDELQIGGRVWRVEVGSGHAPEHVCLACPELDLFLAGDQILPRISSNVSLFPTEPRANPLQDWLDSCARLRGIVSADALVLPSHNEPFYGAPQRLTALIDNHEIALERLLGVLDTPRRAIEPEIFGVLFKRRVTSDNFFMATGESLAHLNCLVHRGLVAQDVDARGVCYYQAV